MTLTKIITTALGLFLVLMLQACHHSPGWHAKDISSLMPPLAFHLTDENGKKVTAANYRGKIVMLFFGYTNCPDYCPTTLAKLAKVLGNMPNERDQVRVLFVSVDPRRDNPERLAVYTSNFAPEVIGLTGTEQALRDLAKRYRTTFGYGKPDSRGNYEVTHGLAVYVFDKHGRARLMILDDQPVAAITADLKQLISLKD